MLNPAFQKFLATLGDEFILAQVLLRRRDRGFELRHAEDRERSEADLRVIPIDGLRDLAQFTESGAFRPIKSAPNLRSGWRASAAAEADLEAALNHLYPGAIADWAAVQSAAPPVTHYREFTARQTGMYRITTMLSDEQAGRMIRACCRSRFCLKHRLWTVAGLETDRASEKSVIPCLEPCAVLLEFARKAVRLEQEDRLPIALGSGEWETVAAALSESLERGGEGIREANFAAASNPRRIQLLLEKVRLALEAGREAADEKDKEK